MVISFVHLFSDAPSGLRTLNARCSRKCAVPFVLSVSARLPASIQTPTVDVCAHGECSVAICTIIYVSLYRGSHLLRSPTVNPFDNVVLSVVAP